MISADFDVKIKLIILVSIALVALLVVMGGLLRRDRHFSRYLIGVTVVIGVLAIILITLLLIHP